MPPLLSVLGSWRVLCERGSGPVFYLLAAISTSASFVVLLFHEWFEAIKNEDVRVLMDINSLVTTTEEKDDTFKENQTIWVLDQIGNNAGQLSMKSIWARF